MSIYHDQRILVAIGLGGRGAFLGYSGQAAHAAITEDSGTLDAGEVFAATGYPIKPGLYTWLGQITIDHYPDDQTPTFCLEGEFRPATLPEIVGLMGVQDPPPEPEDDDREAIQPGDDRYYRPRG